MRTRQQARLIQSASLSEVEDEEASYNPSPTPPPKRKRRVTGGGSEFGETPTRSIRRRGMLSGVLLLPVEVFTEITSHLTPPDIIALSRSNKFFRKFLLNRSSSHIWTTAIRNVPGLPPCPKDLCEPQYVALIFSKHCTICGASVVRTMDPYLNVRLCNSCRDDRRMCVDDIKNETIRRLTPKTFSPPYFCLRSDYDEVEKRLKEILSGTGDQVANKTSWLKERVALCLERRKFAAKLARFLEEMNEARTRELEELKSQRRNDIKQRLKRAGWEEYDWKFPWRLARKWATLVEAPKPITDRVWTNLYPKLERYLEDNHEAQIQRFESDRRRRQERRMRSLLISIKKKSILLKVDKKIVRGEAVDPTDSGSAHLSHLDSDGELPSEAEDSPGGIVFMTSRRERQKVVIERSFPPMIDALALPVVTRLLEDDSDPRSLEERFEDSREEVEEALRNWRDTAENDLVNLLKRGIEKGNSHEGDMESDLEIPQLDLQFELPLEYDNFLEDLPPKTRLLLRADSVFRVANDAQSPLPLFYPELFSIIQDRSQGYYGRGFEYYHQSHPKLGRPWKTSDVECYPDGIQAAKQLLDEIGRPDATQFELQALGPRFVCGLCSDKWVRTWNEIVQHYAEALSCARLAKKNSASGNLSVVYNDIHSPNPASRAKGKNKPLVIFHTRKEAKALSAEQPPDRMLFQCNLCSLLGVFFRAPKDIITKHVRAVHAIKAPKAEHRSKTNDFIDHYYINTRVIKPRVSESSSEESSVDDETRTERAREFGAAVHWSEWKSKRVESDED